MGKLLLWLQERFQHWTKPATPMLISSFLSDLPRSQTELLVENALLCQQLIVLNRQVKRPQSWSSEFFQIYPATVSIWSWKTLCCANN